MWFLSAIVTFGAAFFPMFYRLVEGRNTHFSREADLERQIAEYLKAKGSRRLLQVRFSLKETRRFGLPASY